jgi:hypothetical protein
MLGGFTGVDAKEKKGIRIQPSDLQEKCFEVPSDKILNFSFHATKPLNFDIHYHLKEKTVYPVSGQASKWKGIFHPDKNQKVYCLQWKNPLSEPVTLDYTYTIE